MKFRLHSPSNAHVHRYRQTNRQTERIGYFIDIDNYDAMVAGKFAKLDMYRTVTELVPVHYIYQLLILDHYLLRNNTNDFGKTEISQCYTDI